jgi:hypothetical protein
LMKLHTASLFAKRQGGWLYSIIEEVVHYFKMFYFYCLSHNNINIFVFVIISQ